MEVPTGWARVGVRGLGPFVTREVFRRPDGTRVSWESRWHRKHPAGPRSGSTWWAPRAMAWWIGVLFAVGSVCFALGSFPPYATAVGTNSGQPDLLHRVDLLHHRLLPAVLRGRLHADVARTTPHRRVLGSLFRVAAPPDRLVGRHHPTRRHPVVQPDDAQRAVVGLGASTDHHPVWRPDALGSICFLVSSWLAWAEECHGPFAWRPAAIPWWITLLNLVGSVAFGVSAIASYVEPNGQLVSLALTNLGTFVGASASWSVPCSCSRNGRSKALRRSPSLRRGSAPPPEPVTPCRRPAGAVSVTGANVSMSRTLK